MENKCKTIKISFTDEIVETARQQCPICGSANKHPLLTMQDVSLVPGGLHMSSCDDCGTGYFTDENPVVGYDFDGFNQDYGLNYVQNGAGISAMLEPLLAVDRPRKGSLPDIVDGFADWPVYLSYLDKLSHNADHHVAGGALYRAYKEAFNLGFFDQADYLYSRFLPLARDRYGFDFDDIAASTDKRRARTELDNATFPSWLGVSMLYAGLINKRHGAPLEKLRVLFSEAVETMQAEIEMGAQFAGEPFHFISSAKRELMEVLQKQRAANPTAADPKQSYLLRRPKQIVGQDVCLFSIYAPGGKVSPATVTYVEGLAKNGFTVIACVALDDPTADFDVASLSAAAGIVVHKNGGMDFAAWAGALRLLPECWSASRLVFTNDSVFMLPDLMKPFVERLRLETADFVGLTDSLCIIPHVQSYFFQFQGAALSNPKLHAFWASVQVFTDKKDVIRTYEVKLLQHVTDGWGLTNNTMFSLDKILPHATAADCAQLNVSHSYWDHLVSQGFPFVKVELLRDNPLQLNILHWRSVFEAHGASVDLVEKHLEIRKSHASLLQQDRSEWRMILRDINRVRLNARRRRQARKIIDAV